MKFFVGLHQPSDAKHFNSVCISVNRVRNRRKPVPVGDLLGGEVLLDSGAFTEIAKYGGYRHGVEEYAEQVRRLLPIMPITAAVSQDYMCEPHMLAKTGLTVEDHQRLTIERYDALLACKLPVYIMPVLQGYEPADYAEHVRQYGSRLGFGAWVGVGSVCKRNSNPEAISRVLQAIKRERPDLRLHGFGVKLTALTHSAVRDLLHTADSMAWSFHARKNGRSANDWREAARFCAEIDKPRTWNNWQMEMAI